MQRPGESRAERLPPVERDADHTNGGSIERTLTSDCDACGAITEVHVIGPYGGVLAFCADPEACGERQRSGAAARDAAQGRLGFDETCQWSVNITGQR